MKKRRKEERGGKTKKKKKKGEKGRGKKRKKEKKTKKKGRKERKKKKKGKERKRKDCGWRQDRTALPPPRRGRLVCGATKLTKGVHLSQKPLVNLVAMQRLPAGGAREKKNRFFKGPFLVINRASAFRLKIDEQS